METQEYVVIGVAAVVAYATGYFMAYSKEHAKQQAQLHTIKELEEAKSKVELESTRKKFKYENKQGQFLKYIGLIDQLNTKAFDDTYEKFLPATTEFSTDFYEGQVNGDQIKITNCTTKYQKVIQSLMFDNQKYLLRIKNETAGLRIVAGVKIIQMLDEMEKGYTKLFDISADVMKKFPDVAIKGEVKEIELLQVEASQYSSRIEQLKQSIIQEMRNELDEI